MRTTAGGSVLYADASALVKLVVEEPESATLARVVAERAQPLATSAVSLVELLRAVRVAAAGGGAVAVARTLLSGIALVELDRRLLEAAVPYTSTRVRTLDAVHLVSALEVQARTMLVYDRRLAEAAEAAGIEPLAPGR